MRFLDCIKSACVLQRGLHWALNPSFVPNRFSGNISLQVLEWPWVICSVNLLPSTTHLRRALCRHASVESTPFAATPVERSAALPASCVRPSALLRWIPTRICDFEMQLQYLMMGDKECLQSWVTTLKAKCAYFISLKIRGESFTKHFEDIVVFFIFLFFMRRVKFHVFPAFVKMLVVPNLVSLQTKSTLWFMKILWIRLSAFDQQMFVRMFVICVWLLQGSFML